MRYYEALLAAQDAIYFATAAATFALGWALGYIHAETKWRKAPAPAEEKP